MPFNGAYDDSKAANRVLLVGGSNSIGFVTVSGSLGNSGNVTLNVSPNFIGLVTSYNVDPLLRAGEDLTNNRLLVSLQYSYQSLTSLVTITPKSAAGVLRAVVVGGQSLPTINLWDNTAASGTLIGTINASSPPGTYTYDVSFATGLTVQPLPGTAVLPNFTISYR